MLEIIAENLRFHVKTVWNLALFYIKKERMAHSA